MDFHSVNVTILGHNDEVMEPIDGGERLKLVGNLELIVGDLVLTASRKAIDPGYEPESHLYDGFNLAARVSKADEEMLSSKVLDPDTSRELLVGLYKVRDYRLFIREYTRIFVVQMLKDFRQEELTG